ncbi:MAG: hypothetical protein ABI120_04065 [Gemmatimonadaceae bacterium]
MLSKLCQNKVRSRAIFAVAMVTFASCDRFKGPNNAGELALVQRQFDSASAVRDSMLRASQAEQDSLFVAKDVRQLSERVRPRPLDPIPLRGVISRAEQRGDSMARARANELIQQTRTVVKVDTMRGEVRLDGSGPGARPMLITEKGRTKVSLTGMGTDGLSQIVGTEVVIRGMLASPHDMVVSGFSVRAVNGLSAFDGRLVQQLGGGWAIDMSDRSGMRKLATMPQALTAFEGGRVWIAEEPGKGGAQLYGVISRR